MRGVLVFLAAFLFVVPLCAQAQDRAAPASREQIQMSFAPLVREVTPAVVSVSTRRTVTQRVSPFMGDPLFDQLFGQAFGFGGGLTRKRIEDALGSGVIVDSEGLIVTNAHVVRNAEEITVVMNDGREFPAKKTLVDAPSDLALLRIDAQGEKLPFVNLEPSEKLEVGDLVLAIGNPFGVGQTVTSGIISALARSSLNINDFNFFIQTDAAINPGNSGGALVAMDGSVVGINSAIYSRDGGSLGIGFAIPSEMVATVIAAEKAGQVGNRGIVRAWLGVTAQDVSADIADSLGFDAPHGVLIAKLHSDSPLKKAGAQAGDVVTAVNGKPVREAAEMKFRIATVPIGASADFEIMRDGNVSTINVAAAAPPDNPPRDETLLSGNHPFAGATVSNINPAVSVELGFREEEGVAVTKVGVQSAAARIVAPGEVIISVNGEAVMNVKELQKTLKRPAAAWQLVISNDGRKRQIVIR
ncbi:MAG: Do family serine endopeptidase [Proteobacteria bacterium]|nr:Do family serine endopeptidase [Pseudomonadota bacterium]